MIKFLGNKRLFVLLLSLILFTLVMGLTKGGRERLTWPEMFLKDTVSWVQSLFYEPARHVTGFFGDLNRLDVLYEENKALKRSLSRYATDSAKLSGLESENARLRTILEYQGSKATDIDFKVAEVVSRSPDRWNNVITIDLGSKHGIKKDMAVITPGGLVGRVQTVSHLFSNVQLVTDIEQGSRVSALIQNKQQSAFGIIEGYDAKTDQLIMKRIKLDDPVSKGDYVITSGWGEVFPYGLMIGQVEEVMIGQYGLTKIARIKPSADLYHLYEVLVVERSMQVPPRLMNDSSTDGESANEGDGS
jgi:rod shape-determining protein MreC